VLAANMSTCSAFLVDGGALFTAGLYRRRLAPGRPDAHYLWVGRASGLLITMLGVLYAMFLVESVLYTFLLTETLATFVGISVLGGILWPRANRWGALASIVVALVGNFALHYITGQRLDHWDANVFLAALLSGIAALVVVSLVTTPEPAPAIESFYDRLQTASDPPHPATHSPRRGGPGPESTDRPLLLVNLLRLGKAARGRGWRVYREDLGGFVLGWVLVIVLVLLTAAFLAL
jgi:Na+/proline symporter